MRCGSCDEKSRRDLWRGFPGSHGAPSAWAAGRAGTRSPAETCPASSARPSSVPGCMTSMSAPACSMRTMRSPTARRGSPSPLRCDGVAQTMTWVLHLLGPWTWAALGPMALYDPVSRGHPHRREPTQLDHAGAVTRRVPGAARDRCRGQGRRERGCAPRDPSRQLCARRQPDYLPHRPRHQTGGGHRTRRGRLRGRLPRPGGHLGLERPGPGNGERGHGPRRTRPGGAASASRLGLSRR